LPFARLLVVGDDRSSSADSAADPTPQARNARQGRLVFGQRQQQVLHGHEFVALLAGLLVAMADGDFEILAEHSDRLRLQS
jgi:hypothetical protein